MDYGRWNSDRAAREYVRRGEVAVYRAQQELGTLGGTSRRAPMAAITNAFGHADQLQDGVMISAPIGGPMQLPARAELCGLLFVSHCVFTA